MNKIRTIASICFLLMVSVNAFSACKWVWVDHDYDTSTPAMQKQICDSTIDIDAIRPPSIRPIQAPQIKPIGSPSVPPIGTDQCRTQSVYENGNWVNKKLCY